MLSEKEFDKNFKIISNKADGNCLFESIEYHLIYSDYEFKYGITKATKIREMVGNFYKIFDKEKDYPDDTIEYRIKMGLLFDNIDDNDDDDDVMLHDINICNDKVWASMTDVLICSLLFEMNIDLYVKHNLIEEDGDDINIIINYELTKIETQHNFTTTMRLLYSGKNHFEAIEQRF
jgi:hypothetical protein